MSKQETIEKDGIKFRVLHYGITGADKLLLLNPYSVDIPFECKDCKLTDFSYTDFPDEIYDIEIKDNRLYITLCTWNGASGPTFDNFSVFSKKWCLARGSLIHDCMLFMYSQEAEKKNYIFDRFKNDDWYKKNIKADGAKEIRAFWHLPAVKLYSAWRKFVYWIK